LLLIEPDNRNLKIMEAATAVGLGEFERALKLYRDLLTGDGAADAEAHLSIGHAQKTLGQTPAAIESYRRAAELRPGFGDAYWSLANLKTYRFGDDDLARMHALESQPNIAGLDRTYLCFALGKALEDRGDYANSWAYYSRGNAVVRAGSRYRPDIPEDNSRALQQAYTPEFFAARADWGATDPAPIFILGLPRSGSTLIEQILASHPQVEGTEELTEIDRYAHEISGGPQNLTAAEARRLGGDLGVEIRHGERVLFVEQADAARRQPP